MPRLYNVMNTVPDQLIKPLANLLLALADDKLFLGHRSSDWTGLGPILEEDIAFSHLAQDEMAHAQAIYQFVGEIIGNRGGADELAFGRAPSEYRCASIVEVPDEFDWATALARKFFCDHFDALRLERLSNSSHKSLADLSRRMYAEEMLHVEHVDGWMVRLGRGTADSRTRMQRALDGLTPHAIMLFETVEGEQQLAHAGLYPELHGEMFNVWRDRLQAIAQRASLNVNLAAPNASQKGGRCGMHTPHFKEMLDEMCEVYRIEPGAAW